MKIDDLAKDPEAWNKNAEQEAARATARLQFKHRAMSTAAKQIAQSLWAILQDMDVEQVMRFYLSLDGNRLEVTGATPKRAVCDLSVLCAGERIGYSQADLPDITSRCAAELDSCMSGKLAPGQFRIITDIATIVIRFEP